MGSPGPATAESAASRPAKRMRASPGVMAPPRPATVRGRYPGPAGHRRRASGRRSRSGPRPGARNTSGGPGGRRPRRTPCAAPGRRAASAAAAASAAGSRAGISRPVVPCTTLSVRPPTALATTGTPQAIASSGVMPNGSYQGVHTTTSADRIRAGTWARGTAPVNTTRSATPRARAMSRSRRYSASPPSWSRSGPPATTSSAPGSRASASMAVSMPLRSTSRPSVSSRPGDSRRATAPDGQKVPVSTPHGTTDTLPAGMPSWPSSRTSSRQVAMT